VLDDEKCNVEAGRLFDLFEFDPSSGGANAARELGETQLVRW
jgi:hypothetical protein